MLARPGCRPQALAFALACAFAFAGCDSKPATQAQAKPEPAQDKPANDKNDKDDKNDKNDKNDPQKTFATPTAKPPPPPEGAYLHEKPALYIQRCTAQHPCPKKLQPAGEIHCREFGLGAYKEGWRLPSLEEAKLFAGIDALEDKEGFHWTGTAYKEDAKQAWIVDPKGGQSTTVARDRKPFTIRCVYEP